MTEAFVGIDLAIAKGKRLPVVICTLEEYRVIPKRLRSIGIEPPLGIGNAAAIDLESVKVFTKNCARYLSDVCRLLEVAPIRIGIDAPSAPCPIGLRRRNAEAALDEAGISCFATPGADDLDVIREKVRLHLASGGREDRIPHANQLWMLVGFDLFRELSLLARCLEVFPQATIRRLGIGKTHKSQRGAVTEQLAAVSRHTGWEVGNLSHPRLDEICWGASHDQLDAYMSAWVASLEESDRFGFGAPPDDVIWVPRIAAAPMQSVANNPPTHGVERRTIAIPKAINVVICPGCGKKEFKRWPWGWDGHAAYACTGLLSTTPEMRKLEFRNRFAEFF